MALTYDVLPTGWVRIRAPFFVVENKTARLTLLLDPRKKAMFEEICAAQDLTPSQVVRQLIREYIIEHAGNRPLPAWLLTASKKRPALPKRPR